LGGRAAIGQRFAIDWAQVYADGQPYSGDALINKNYRGYGQPVYAVADGVVSEVKDGIPENIPDPVARAVEITLDTVAGNHVIEKIGENAYATFAHLQPGSLRVKLGEHIHQGEEIGLLGNSGNSTAPHLHFQLCDANSVLACEGLPYALSTFDVEGRWKPEGAMVHHELELPTEGEVVKFAPMP
jgi:murein DD-endopeptidase MepM/ murein hydrolase activator NlpD